MNLFKWLDDRTGLATGFNKMMNWTVPATKCCARILPTVIVFAFLLQGITGVFLWAFFAPAAQTAWESVYYIQYQVPCGWLVRGIHHYSAQLLVGALGLYILHMILSGMYRKPREFVYWSALVMFGFSLCSCLTGDLLNWSLSGYFATITRVSFLQLLPKIGVPLYQLVVGGPDPQFGTLTLTRFTVLHIMVFGGGFFALMVFWKWVDIRSRKNAVVELPPKEKAFWNSEILLGALACVVFLCATFALVFQHSLTQEQIAQRVDTLPAQAYLGADLTSPADPGGSFDAARPEWSFRALYFWSKLSIFSKIGMIFAIFVGPGILAAWFFALPILAYIKPFHYLIALVTAAMFVVFCLFTYWSYWDDYKNPAHAPGFLASQAQANVLKKRSIELVTAPAGIPKEGALTLLQKDSFIQGPKLFQQHCASCHNFEPTKDVKANADFLPIKCAQPTAPNLYGSGSVEWIVGFHDKDKLVSDDYFGKTTSFGKKGSMYAFATGRVFSGLLDKQGNFILNSANGLVSPLIAPDASIAFDVLEAAFGDLTKDAKNKEMINKGEYIPKLKELVAAKFKDAKFIAGLENKAPKPVMAALETVLLGTLDDKEYVDMLKNKDNIETILDDAAAFIEETFLAKLNGDGEPIPPAKMKYIEQLRAGIMVSCNDVAKDLQAETKLDAIRPLVDGKYKGLREDAISDMAYLTCTECHAFYGSEKKDLACDLRGYMNRAWLIGIISDPAAKTYYGKKNDRMPSYRPASGEAIPQLIKDEE